MIGCSGMPKLMLANEMLQVLSVPKRFDGITCQLLENALLERQVQGNLYLSTLQSSMFKRSDRIQRFKDSVLSSRLG